MNLTRTVKKVTSSALRAIYTALPLKGITNPIFIIGCGRSGTTIFGKALAKHRLVTYLNEPRHLWFSAYPQTDIWTSKAIRRGGKIIFNDSDTEKKKNEKLSRLFKLETIRQGKPVLIEKLPINTFRLPFIFKIFPDARFLHIYRNGIEVAKSIEKMCKNGLWYGRYSYKWEKLVEYALSKKETKYLPTMCLTDFEKGLLEWRLSTEAVVNFFRNIPNDLFFEFEYDDLIKNPSDTLSEVLEFIGIGSDPGVAKFVAENIERKTLKIESNKITKKEFSIGGPLLPLSMDGNKGLTSRKMDCILGL